MAGAARPNKQWPGGTARLVGELRRVLAKVDRAAAYRATTREERRWCARVGDELEQLAREGAVLASASAAPHEAGN